MTAMPTSSTWLRSDHSGRQPDASPRLEGLDALRGIAAIGVIALHAAIPYLMHPMPGLLWPARDASPSPAVDAVFWGIEGFIMPLFFFLSGFVAWGLLRRLGPRDFVTHRVRRVLGPLAFACVVILPLDLYAWALGLVSEGLIPWRPLKTLKFPPEIARDLWGLSHLWYLQYLFLCSAGLAVFQLVRRRLSKPHITLHQPQSDLGSENRLSLFTILLPLALNLCGAPVLYWNPNIVAGFQHSFLPVAPKFLYSAVYFAAGACLAAFPRWIESTRRFGAAWVLLSVPLLATAIPLIHRQQLAALSGTERAGFAALVGLFASCATLGLFGTFLRFWPTPSKTWKYLAEASFWIYLSHHPLVALLQIDLDLVAIPAAAKFVAVIAAASLLTLATYHVFVRETWVGILLSGRRASDERLQTVPARSQSKAA